MRIGILVQSVAAITPTWTTVHLAHAAVGAGHDVRIFEASDVEVTSTGKLVARAWVVAPEEISRDGLARALGSRRLPRRFVEIGGCDLLLMRLSPMTPTVLSFALAAEDLGVRVINSPMGMARTSAKSWLATLTDVPMPPTLITGNRSSAQVFADAQPGPVVVKPVRGSGGRGVRLVRKGDVHGLDMALQATRTLGHNHVVLQPYLEAASEGEVRLFWVCGEVLGAYRRMRAPGEFRHNLKQGAHPTPCALTEAELQAAHALTPHLLRNGIRIAGIDLIGDQIVEVNTLNPGGLHYADAFQDPAAPCIAQEAMQLLVTPPLPHALPTSRTHKANQA